MSRLLRGRPDLGRDNRKIVAVATKHNKMVVGVAMKDNAIKLAKSRIEIGITKEILQDWAKQPAK